MKSIVVNSNKKMSDVKAILFQMQQAEKKLAVTYDEEVTEGAQPILKEYLQYLKNKRDKSVEELNRCKEFLAKLIESPITTLETKAMIKEFIGLNPYP